MAAAAAAGGGGLVVAGGGQCDRIVCRLLRAAMGAAVERGGPLCQSACFDLGRPVQSVGGQLRTLSGRANEPWNASSTAEKPKHDLAAAAAAQQGKRVAWACELACCPAPCTHNPAVRFT